MFLSTFAFSVHELKTIIKFIRRILIQPAEFFLEDKSIKNSKVK